MTMKKVTFTVEDKGSCKKVFIPKGYCTIIMEGTKLEDIYELQDGDNVCIENTDLKLECQNG
jgi:hypothetical protein